MKHLLKQLAQKAILATGFLAIIGTLTLGYSAGESAKALKEKGGKSIDVKIKQEKDTVVVQEKSPLFLNAHDFGAAGDGKKDDTKALVALFAAACEDKPGVVACRQVVLPAGTYRITETLFIEGIHNNLVIRGTGGVNCGKATTTLAWDGPKGGTMIAVWAQMGLQMYDLMLDGRNKAGILFGVNSTDKQTKDTTWSKKYGQAAASGFHLERMKFFNAEIGVDLSSDSYINSDCIDFINPGFAYLKIGFRGNSEQNLVYLFQRPDFGWVDTGFVFIGGGYATASLVNCHHVDVVFHISGCGINSGVFELSTVRNEQGGRTTNKHPITLIASGEANIKFTGLQTTCNGVFGPEADLETPTFILGPSANVVVEASMLSGKIAKLTGSSKDVPTWIEFNNCRFRAASDPQKDISADEYSGYAFRNCIVTKDDTRGKEYKIFSYTMLPYLVKYPKQAQGQPGWVK